MQNPKLESEINWITVAIEKKKNVKMILKVDNWGRNIESTYYSKKLKCSKNDQPE